MKKLSRFIKIIEDAEITIELNPDDITESKLKELKSIGFNRLSIGVQSFFDEDLKIYEIEVIVVKKLLIQ